MALPGGGVWRNANIYTCNNHDNLIDLWIAEGITNASLYSMVEIFCTFSNTFNLRYDTASGPLVEKDQSPLQVGNYFIVTNGKSPLCFSH